MNDLFADANRELLWQIKQREPHRARYHDDHGFQEEQRSYSNSNLHDTTPIPLNMYPFHSASSYPHGLEAPFHSGHGYDHSRYPGANIPQPHETTSYHSDLQISVNPSDIGPVSRSIFERVDPTIREDNDDEDDEAAEGGRSRWR